MFLPSELSVCTTAITQSCCLYTVMDGLWIGKGPWAIRSALRLWASSTELPLTWVVLVIGGPITSNSSVVFSPQLSSTTYENMKTLQILCFHNCSKYNYIIFGIIYNYNIIYNIILLYNYIRSTSKDRMHNTHRADPSPPRL